MNPLRIFQAKIIPKCWIFNSKESLLRIIWHEVFFVKVFIASIDPVETIIIFYYRAFLLFECIATVILILSKVDQNEHYFGKMTVLPEWQLLMPKMTRVTSQNDRCSFPKWPVLQQKTSHFDSRTKQNILNSQKKAVIRSKWKVSEIENSRPLGKISTNWLRYCVPAEFAYLGKLLTFSGNGRSRDDQLVASG